MSIAIVTCLSSLHSHATCKCYYPIGIPDLCLYPGSIVPGTSVTTTVFTNLAVSTNHIGSCTVPNGSPGEATCQAQGGVTSVNSWEVGGTVNYEAFGVNAQVGGSVTVDGNCTNTQTIDSFCSCCKQRSALEFNLQTADILCQCSLPLGITCTHTDFGATKKTYVQVVCDSPPPACTPPAQPDGSPCDPNCPPPDPTE